MKSTNSIEFKIRLCRCYLAARFVTFNPVIRSHGAPSIAQGRTPHEVQDELCPGADLVRA